MTGYGRHNVFAHRVTKKSVWVRPNVLVPLTEVANESGEADGEGLLAIEDGPADKPADTGAGVSAEASAEGNAASPDGTPSNATPDPGNDQTDVGGAGNPDERPPEPTQSLAEEVSAMQSALAESEAQGETEAGVGDAPGGPQDVSAAVQVSQVASDDPPAKPTQANPAAPPLPSSDSVASPIRSARSRSPSAKPPSPQSALPPTARSLDSAGRKGLDSARSWASRRSGRGTARSTSSRNAGDARMKELLTKSYDDASDGDADDAGSLASKATSTSQMRRARKGHRKLGSARKSKRPGEAKAELEGADEAKATPVSDSKPAAGEDAAAAAMGDEDDGGAATLSPGGTTSQDVTPRSSTQSMVDGGTTLLNMNSVKRGRFAGLLSMLAIKRKNKIGDEKEEVRKRRESDASQQSQAKSSRKQRRRGSRRSRGSRYSHSDSSDYSDASYSDDSYSDYSSDDSYYSRRSRRSRARSRSRRSVYSTRSRASAYSYSASARSGLTYASYAQSADQALARRRSLRDASRRRHSRRKSHRSVGTSASQASARYRAEEGADTIASDSKHDFDNRSVVSGDSHGSKASKGTSLTASTQWEEDSDEEINGLKIRRREYERVKFHLPLWFREVQVDIDTTTVPGLLCGYVRRTPRLEPRY